MNTNNADITACNLAIILGLIWTGIGIGQFTQTTSPTRALVFIAISLIGVVAAWRIKRQLQAKTQKREH